jgi:hypothetical protein
MEWGVMREDGCWLRVSNTIRGKQYHWMYFSHSATRFRSRAHAWTAVESLDEYPKVQVHQLPELE